MVTGLLTRDTREPPVDIVRLRTEADLDAVQEVDAECFLNPWTREMYRRELDRPDTCHLYGVRTPGCAVAAYCNIWLVADEVQINNLATRPAFRGRGYGAALVAHALAIGRGRGARLATLEVRASNEAARRLYERLGFRQHAVRRGYYTKPVEDGLVLWRDLI